MKIAVFPGSFDPITLGHTEIILRALPLFDKIIIAVGSNSSKQNMFSLNDRLNWIKETFKDEPKIEPRTYTGLTVEFCKNSGAGFLLRGLRNTADFEYEKAIGEANKHLHPDLETVFLTSTGYTAFISSSIVRDIMRHGGDYKKFVPRSVKLS